MCFDFMNWVALLKAEKSSLTYRKIKTQGAMIAQVSLFILIAEHTRIHHDYIAVFSAHAAFFFTYR